MPTHQFSREEFRDIADVYASNADDDVEREFVVGTYRGDVVWQAYFIDWKNGSGSFISSIPTKSPQRFTYHVAKGLGIKGFQSGQIRQIDENRFQLHYRTSTENCLAWVLLIAVIMTLLTMYLA